MGWRITCLKLAQKYIPVLDDKYSRSDWRVKYANLVSKYKHNIGAELGVFRGQNARCMLENLPNLRQLYCIDLWQHYSDYSHYPGHDKGEISFDEVYSEYSSTIEPHKNRIITLRMSSKDAIKCVEDESLDFIFIDANHDYEHVKQDILLWAPKVRPRGLISGHDYTNDKNAVRYGVKRAVDELFPNANVSGTIWWISKNIQ